MLNQTKINNMDYFEKYQHEAKIANDLLAENIKLKQSLENEKESHKMTFDLRGKVINELQMLSSHQQKQIDELEANLEYAENGHLAIQKECDKLFLQNRQLEKIITEKQYKINELQEELNKLKS